MTTIKKSSGGSPRMNPNGSISQGCCCKCYIDLGDCTVETCTNAEGAGCCYKCGDTASVTLGDIVASGTGTYKPAAAMLAAASGSTLLLTFIGLAGSGSWLSFAHWSTPRPNPDADDGYRWGFGVRLSYLNPSGPASAAYWGVYVQLYRVTEAAFFQGGPCGGVETWDVMQPTGGYGDPGSIYPEFAKKSSCCGGEDIPVSVIFGDVTELTSCTNIATVTVTGDCDSVCACGALADEVTVETGDIRELLTRVGQAVCDSTPETCECWWIKQQDMGLPCPYTTYEINLERSGCQWELSIQELVYENVMVEGEPVCVQVSTNSGSWVKVGGVDVLGTYTRVDGTLGEETAVVE
jgi:hypothetical protein